MVFNGATYFEVVVLSFAGMVSPPRKDPWDAVFRRGPLAHSGIKRATGYCRGTHHCCTCNPRNPPKTRPQQNAPPYTPKVPKNNTNDPRLQRVTKMHGTAAGNEYSSIGKRIHQPAILC